MSTGYVPVVWMRWDPGLPALRSAWPTLAEAKAEIDTERERAGKEPLTWTDEFNGSTAADGDLQYDVMQVEVNR